MVEGRRVLVCGGRGYAGRQHLFSVLDSLQPVSLLIEGGARGADHLAMSWAYERGVLRSRFDADWDQHGKSAGAIRNEQMLREGKPDLVIAFPGGKGTADMVRRAKKAGVPVIDAALALPIPQGENTEGVG